MKLKHIFEIAAAAAVLAVGCTTEKERMEEHNFDNRLYINVSVNKDEILVKPSSSDAPVVRTLTVGTALKADNRITGKFVADLSLIDKYKSMFYDDEVVALPSDKCSIPQPDVVVEAGAVASAPVNIEFTGLGDLDRETVYVMPIALRNVQGIDVLESKTEVYYVFKGAALINIVAGMANNRAYPDFNNDAKFNNLTNFTMEALVRPNKFGKLISTLMGIEGHFLLRFGDAGVPDNQLQVACNTNRTNSDLQVETGVWTHIAVAFDNGNVTVYYNGVQKMSENVGRTSVNLGAKHHNEEDGSRVFWIGYSYEAARYFDGDISEVRIWNRTLTKEEITAPLHFYTVDPNSEGLISYWKFDEEAGNIIKDYSSSGYDLTCDTNPEWNKVSLP
ncbi:MAG: DUF1735 and LamG domain-containing protein [Candidatus Cryptobacteroides sp.]